MADLYPFFFRFGVSFNYHIPKDIIVKVSEFLSSKFSIKIDIDETKKFECIAIEDTEAQNSSIIAVKFYNRYEEYNLNPSKLSNAILFFDVESTYSDKFTDSYLIPNLVKLNTSFSDSNSKRKHPIFIMYVPDLDETSLTFDNLLGNHLKHSFLDNCFIFDRNANFLYKKTEIETDKDLYGIIQLISSPALEKFQAKLVRKIDHFKRISDGKNLWIGCQQYFYEAVNSEKEIFELIKNELIKLIEEEKFNIDFIVFSCPESPWLENSIKSVFDNVSSGGFIDIFPGLFNKNEKKPEHIINLNDDNDIRVRDSKWKTTEKLNIVFITDLINTGITFKEKIQTIKKKFPNSSIKCISALVTDDAIENFEDKTDTHQQLSNGTYIAIRTGLIDYDIKYFLSVEQTYKPKNSPTTCHMCKYNLLPPVEISRSIRKELTSYEFWKMCEESGYKLEDNKPRTNRDKIHRIIPDTLKLFKKNMPLLAVKFEKYISSAGLDMEIEKIIVFADNSNNFFKNDETKESFELKPNGYFVKSLNFFNSNYSYIGIPRELILLSEEGELDTDKATPFTNVFDALDEIDNDKPVIIIDENNFTGKTFKAIFNILKRSNILPKCYFPIINYDPVGTSDKYNDDQYENVVFLSLYNFDNYDE